MAVLIPYVPPKYSLTHADMLRGFSLQDLSHRGLILFKTLLCNIL